MRKKLPKSINLVESINTPGDAFTIFYEWAFIVGRYLLVFVQILVVLVFVMRLTVDKINNDLTKEINNQVEVLLQSGVKENEGVFRNFQAFFYDLDYLDETQVKNSRRIVSVLDNIPEDIELLSYSFSSNRINCDFEASSLEDIKNYEAFLKQSPEYSNVRLELKKLGDENYEFSVNYIIGTEENE